MENSTEDMDATQTRQNLVACDHVTAEDGASRGAGLQQGKEEGGEHGAPMDVDPTAPRAKKQAADASPAGKPAGKKTAAGRAADVPPVSFAQALGQEEDEVATPPRADDRSFRE